MRDFNRMIVLSHFTGHMLTGFGAAVKNMGMGCAARRGKLAQHCEVSPKVSQDHCTACGLCIESCPVNAIAKVEGKVKILENECIGCAQCISVCPVKAVRIVWSESYDMIGERMAEYAYAASLGKEISYINFCLFITKDCDCMNKEKEGFIEDIGILISNDPVAIDKAGIDLIVKDNEKNPLKEAHPKINYLTHLQYAQELGLGSLDYNLIEI